MCDPNSSNNNTPSPLVNRRQTESDNKEPVPGNDAPVSTGTSVGISKATALKYSIATLLLWTSSVIAGIYTYLVISAILSAVAIPVLFAAISVASALVALGSTVYLVSSFVSAVNSEKKVDFSGRELEHSKLEGSSEECKREVLEKQQKKGGGNGDVKMQPVTMAPATHGTPAFSKQHDGTSSTPPPPLPQGAGATPPPPPALGATLLPPPQGAMLAQIQKGNFQLRKTDNKLEATKKPANNGGGDLMTELFKKIKSKRVAIKLSDSESDRSYHSDSDDWSDSSVNKQKEPREKKLTKHREKSTPPTSQLNKKEGTRTSDSGYRSDDDVSQQEPKIPASFNHQPSIGKPLVPPKPANLQTEPQASPATTTTNEEKEPPTSSVRSRCGMFGGIATKHEKQSVLDTNYR